MSSATWTRVALASELRHFDGSCWRVVEAQHKVSTLKLVDSVAEQTLLENLIENSKPMIPQERRRLHFLLASPFRYNATYPGRDFAALATLPAFIMRRSSLPRPLLKWRFIGYSSLSSRRTRLGRRMPPNTQHFPLTF